jgi:hypothetical protein
MFLQFTPAISSSSYKLQSLLFLQLMSIWREDELKMKFGLLRWQYINVKANYVNHLNGVPSSVRPITAIAVMWWFSGLVGHYLCRKHPWYLEALTFNQKECHHHLHHQLHHTPLLHSTITSVMLHHYVSSSHSITSIILPELLFWLLFYKDRHHILHLD